MKSSFFIHLLLISEDKIFHRGKLITVHFNFIDKLYMGAHFNLRLIFAKVLHVQESNRCVIEEVEYCLL